MVRPLLSITLALHEAPLFSRRESEEVLNHFLGGVRDLLMENESVALSVYIAGRFLNIAHQRKTTLLSQLRTFTEEGRLEWLGGGMYDPLLPILPNKMQSLQIRAHRQSLESLVGARPRGFWLPSTVWEQSLIGLLVREGFEFTLLESDQIENATWRTPLSDGYWTVEDRGRVLRILSIDRELSDQLIAEGAEELMSHFEPQEAGLKSRVLSFSFLRDQRGVYEEQWWDPLRDLVRRLTQWGDRAPQFKVLSSQIDERLPAVGMNLHSSVGRSLGLDERLHSCRDLLLQQPESNYLHKRMIWLWKNIERLPEGRSKKSLEEALMPVASLYWYRNGKYGGGVRYLEDRAACHKILNDVELQLRKASQIEGARFDSVDFLGNGDRQLLYRGDQFGFLVEPRVGGRIRSLDYHPHSLSLINGYHPAKPEFPGSVHYAVDPICGLRDWFAPAELNDVASWLQYLQDDRGLLQSPHESNFRIREEGAQVWLSGEQLCFNGGRHHPIKIEKAITVKEEHNELFLSLQVTNLAFHSLQGFYATELNFSFSDWNVEKQSVEISEDRVVSLNDAELHSAVTRVYYSDRESGARLRLKMLNPCSLLTIPISTPTEGERSLSQCLKLFAIWELALMGQQKLNTTFSLRIDRLGLLKR